MPTFQKFVRANETLLQALTIHSLLTEDDLDLQSLCVWHLARALL